MNSTATLVAKLSLAVSDEEKVRDALQNSLQWEYGQYSNPIRCLFLATPRLGIVYANANLAEELLSRHDTFQLGGPLSATFVDGKSYPSNCIEMEFMSEIGRNEFGIIDKIKDIYPSMYLLLRTSHCAVLRFPNCENATEAFEKVSAVVEETASVHHIFVNEHVPVKCYWTGKTSLLTTTKRLKSAGQNITSVVQSCLRYFCRYFFLDY